MRKFPNILACLALLVFSSLAYWPVLNGSSGYIWDDDRHVEENPALRDASGLEHLWTWGPAAVFDPSTRPATQQYYPATYTTFWIEYQLWGRNPLGYHITNFALHILSALLLWYLLRRVGLGEGAAFFAAALFAVHPVNVESVAWISERKNTLSLVFYLLAALCWMRWDQIEMPLEDAYGAPLEKPSAMWIVASAVFFLIALLAKSVTATLPAGLLVLAWWKRGTISRRDLLGTAPLFLIAILSSALTTYIESRYIGAMGPDFALPPAARILVAGHVIVFYLGKLLAPIDLAFFYPHWTLDPASVVQWLYPLGVVIGLIALFRLRRKIGRGPLAAALLFILALAPALGFVNFYPMKFSYVADHFQYLATFVFFAFLAAALAMLLRPVPGAAKAGLAAVVLLILSWLSYRQTFAYKDEITLYQKTLQANPDAWMAGENLANLLCKGGGPAEFPAARALYYRVIEINPQDVKAYSSLSTTLIAMKNLPEAQDVLERAVAIAPGDAPTQANLGNALMLQGKFAAAMRHYDIAAAVDPNNVETLFNWGNALLLAHDAYGAEDKFRRVLKFSGGEPEKILAKYNFYLGLALRDENKAAAVNYFDNAIRLDPNKIEAYYELANIHARLHEDQLAYQELQSALHLNPNFLPAHQALARLLGLTRDATLRNPLERIEHLQKVVDLTGGQNTGDLVELSDALQASDFLEQASDAMDKAVRLAREQQLPPAYQELLLMRAQQLHVALNPIVSGPPSVLSNPGLFEKALDTQPAETDPQPVSVHLIKPP